MAVKDQPTRANMLREKRDKRPRKSSPKSQRSSQKASKGTMPPILVRGGMAASAAHSRKKRKNTRRRYDIAINNQGAEMRLPSVPSFGIGWRLLSGLLVISLGFIVYMLWYSPVFTVSTLDVAGFVRLTNEEINSVANVIGKSIILVNPSTLEQDLRAAFPELVNVSVNTEIPNKVVVNLGERKPVITWQQDGQNFWIDAHGVAFKPSGEGGPSITVQGSELLSIKPPEGENLEEEGKPSQSLPVELVNAILAISQETPENTPLVYDSKYGLGWQDPRGWQVYFGKGDDQIDMKLDVYNKTWKRLKKAGISPALINVEHVHAPFYRLER